MKSTNNNVSKAVSLHELCVHTVHMFVFFFSQWLSYFLFPKDLITFYSLQYAALNEHGI